MTNVADTFDTPAPAPLYTIEAPFSSVSMAAVSSGTSVVFWDDPVATWDDPNVSWDGYILTAQETANLQSVFTFSAEAKVTIRDAEVSMQSATTFDAAGVRVRAGQDLMQVAVTFVPEATAGATVQTGEATLQSVATITLDAAKVQAGECTMQVATTFLADPGASAFHAETTMQVATDVVAEAAATVVHAGETLLQTAAYMLADGDKRNRVTGEWFLRGGTRYPPPLNRRKQLQRAHLGTGRRVG